MVISYTSAYVPVISVYHHY